MRRIWRWRCAKSAKRSDSESWRVAREELLMVSKASGSGSRCEKSARTKPIGKLPLVAGLQAVNGDVFGCIYAERSQSLLVGVGTKFGATQVSRMRESDWPIHGKRVSTRTSIQVVMPKDMDAPFAILAITARTTNRTARTPPTKAATSASNCWTFGLESWPPRLPGLRVGLIPGIVILGLGGPATLNVFGMAKRG